MGPSAPVGYEFVEAMVFFGQDSPPTAENPPPAGSQVMRLQSIPSIGTTHLARDGERTNYWIFVTAYFRDEDGDLYCIHHRKTHLAGYFAELNEPTTCENEHVDR